MTIASHANPAWIAKSDYLIHADLADHGMPNRAEQLWARKLGDRLFEICCIPFFTYGIALGDTVETSVDDRVTGVAGKSGRTTARIAIVDESRTDEIHIALHSILEDLHLVHEWFNAVYVAIDLPTIETQQLLLDAVARMLPISSQYQLNLIDEGTNGRDFKYSCLGSICN